MSPWHDERHGSHMGNRFNPQSSAWYINQQIINLVRGQAEVQAQAKAFLEPFKDAVVLIGPEDQLLQDLAPSPFDDQPVPKVGLHGNALKTLVSGNYIHRLPEWVGWLAILLLSPAVTALGIYSGPGSLYAKIASILLLVAYAALVFIAFSQWSLVIPLIAPLGAALMAGGLGYLLQLFFEEKQRSRIKGMFGTYLSKEYVEQLVASGEEPTLGGEEVEITAFFSDVQGFSAFSEKLTPEDLVQLMNEYLGAMTEIIEQAGGTLDKYIGDAIVALYNAPIRFEDHALRACRAAAAMQQMQAQLRTRWAEQGERWPAIVSQMQTRIGLNTGLATVGNMGSEGRFNYTMMGDTVNLAARCESGAKTAGVYTLTTRETMEQATARSSELVFRFVDKWQVKGRAQPADVFELVGFAEAQTKDTLTCIEHYEAALADYFNQRFEAALGGFEAALPLEPNHPDRNPFAPPTPSQVLAQRCKDYLKSPPPADWDGVYKMKTK
jgi:adenylate cyclase